MKNTLKLVKGKPVERRGRKAKGLNLRMDYRDMTAGLPRWPEKQITGLSCKLAVFLKSKQRLPFKQFFSFFLFSYFVFMGFAFANGVAETAVEIVNDDSNEKTAEIEFDFSWNNSWSDSVNNDAIWVFAKYSSNGGATWNHATMKTSGTNPSGFSRGSYGGGYARNIDMIVPPDKKGVFIQAANPGTGLVYFTNVKLVWDYGADGQNDPYATFTSLSTSFVVRIFAIEMVKIPTEGFYAGDLSSGAVGQLEFGGASSSLPGAISSETGLSFGNSATQWYYNTDNGAGNDDATGATFEVGEAFPKGFHSFYLMKYEITEGQYVNFLNTLLRPAQNHRVGIDVSVDTPSSSYVMWGSYAYRNTVQCPPSGNGINNPIAFTTDRPDRAMTMLNWMDFAAYTDWAALRPISELEFEKAARGPSYPIAGEYAWGNTSITACNTISGTEDGTEYCSNGAGYQVNYNGTNFSGGDGGQGPVRAGFFATSSTTTRYDSGAGYYGNMELSGNVWEQIVTLGSSAGRGFSGTHGDGRLVGLSVSGYEGNATNLDWPGIDGTNTYGVTGAAGSGWKGGAWNENAGALEVSNRYYAANSTAARYEFLGGRSARTAPES